MNIAIINKNHSVSDSNEYSQVSAVLVFMSSIRFGFGEK
jgi:hypothetical protein